MSDRSEVELTFLKGCFGFGLLPIRLTLREPSGCVDSDVCGFKSHFLFEVSLSLPSHVAVDGNNDCRAYWDFNLLTANGASHWA